jgi:cobalt/nickel transport system ATP-binding protein
MNCGTLPIPAFPWAASENSPAGALVTNPSLLLLDEPSSALDPPGRLSLAEILQKIDSSILLATHDIEFASRICSRFLVIKDREIREYSSSGEISF